MELEEVRTTLHHHQGMYDTIPPCQSIEDCKRHSFVITMEEKERERGIYIYIRKEEVRDGFGFPFLNLLVCSSALESLMNNSLEKR